MAWFLLSGDCWLSPRLVRWRRCLVRNFRCQIMVQVSKYAPSTRLVVKHLDAVWRLTHNSFHRRTNLKSARGGAPWFCIILRIVRCAQGVCLWHVLPSRNLSEYSMTSCIILQYLYWSTSFTTCMQGMSRRTCFQTFFPDFRN